MGKTNMFAMIENQLRYGQNAVLTGNHGSLGWRDRSISVAGEGGPIGRKVLLVFGPNRFMRFNTYADGEKKPLG